jgi:monoamine oxidase
LLSNLKQRNGAALLAAAVNSGDKRSSTLAAAIEQARKDGVKSHKIAEAEAKLQKLRRDEAVRDEIDAALNPAIGARNLESLELHLQRATANSVTSKTIETARSLVGQLRSQGDNKKIMLLLSDALRLRSVSVLEHVIKSAEDAGKTHVLLLFLLSFPFLSFLFLKCRGLPMH